jgi:hypothetical protein
MARRGAWCLGPVDRRLLRPATNEESKSWAAWMFGILSLGALYLAGEGAAEWISGRDAVTDPLWRRLLHLALLLAVVVVFGLASAMLLSSTK